MPHKYHHIDTCYKDYIQLVHSLCRRLESSWLPASVICQMSSTVSCASSP